MDLDGNPIEDYEIVYVWELFDPKATFVQEVASQRKMLQYVRKVEVRKLHSELQKEVKYCIFFGRSQQIKIPTDETSEIVSGGTY